MEDPRIFEPSRPVNPEPNVKDPIRPGTPENPADQLTVPGNPGGDLSGTPDDLGDHLTLPDDLGGDLSGTTENSADRLTVPGNPGGEPSATPKDLLTLLPNEVLQLIAAYLDPKSLERLRNTSTRLREVVDGYVETLRPRLRSDSSQGPLPELITPEMLLDGWLRGDYTLEPLPSELQKIVSYYDQELRSSYFAPESNLMFDADVTLQYRDQPDTKQYNDSQRFRLYVGELLRTGRLVDKRNGRPLELSSPTLDDQIDTALQYLAFTDRVSWLDAPSTDSTEPDAKRQRT